MTFLLRLINFKYIINRFLRFVQALPSLSSSELPPAIGLILKLASGNEASCKSAVAAVRDRVKGSGDDAPPTGAIDALRLAVVQHPIVANTILEAIQEECKVPTTGDSSSAIDTTTTATPEESVPSTCSAPPALTIPDVHVLLDCLALPSHRSDAVVTVEKCALAGRLHIETLSECLMERHHSLTATSTSHSNSGTAALENDQANKDEESSSSFEHNEKSSIMNSSALSVLSSAQRAFVGAHPLASDPGDGPIPEVIAEQLRLAFPRNESPAGLPSLAASASSDELGGLLAACGVLMHANNPVTNSLAGRVLLTLYRHFKDSSSQRRVLSFLAHVALSCAPVTTISDGTNISASVLTSSLLATLASQSPGGGSLVLSVVLEIAAVAQQKAEHTYQEASTNAARHTQELASQRSAVSKAESAQRRAEEQVSELESAIARRTAEHAAELAGLASDRKELQAQLRSAEQQVEWVKSERDEERTVRARESRDAAQRLAEAEAQLARLKATRRDEQKRSQKDRSVLSDRLREAEDALERIEADAARSRNDASIAVSRAEKSTQEARRRIEAAEHAVKQRDAEIGALRNAAAERDAHLRAVMEAQRSLEQHLAAERQRVAMLTTGAGLEAASPGELKTVAGVLETSLRRVNGMLMGPGGGNNRVPTPTLGAAASPGSKGPPGGFRQAPPGQSQAQPNHPPFARPPMHGLGGGHSSLDSMGSLQGSESGGGGGGGGLFGGPEWGLSGHSSSVNSINVGGGSMNNGNHSHSHIHNHGGQIAPGQEVDSASMEKLLGLLPSDLLHS